ncbi:hypothetical protein Tco_1197228, partial [Tanacetum coccineum]
GFKLHASHVIHTVGPDYDYISDVSALLNDAYRYLLRMACVLQKKTILSMFPFPPYHVASSGEFIKFVGQVEARELQLYMNIEKVNF